MVFMQGAPNNDEYFGLYNSGGTYQWRCLTSSGGSFATVVIYGTTVAINTWYHVALVRSGNNWYILQGGVALGAATVDDHAWFDYSSLLYIGSYTGTSCFLNGWLDEFRVSKGVARWTSNFTPPAGAYASDSSAVLLLHMDGADGSTQFPDVVT
jgi:hypothetical protein